MPLKTLFPLALLFPALLFATPHDRLVSNVAAAANFELLYELPIPDDGVFQQGTPVPYSIDNSGVLTGAFDRIAYYLERNDEWVFVSMDPFEFELSKLGLPHHLDNPVSFQQIVSNLQVWASAGANVNTGLFASSGNIELWSNNYGNNNAAGVPHADQGGNRYDWGDAIAALNPGYGSFQVHNHDIDGAGSNTVGEVVLAYNHWGSGGIDDVGIGSQPTGNPDWTFSGNANSFTNKNLLILMRPIPAPPAPQNVTVTLKTDVRLELAWDTVSNATEYIVLQNGVETARVSTNEFKQSCLVPGSGLDVEIQAITPQGFGARSPVLPITLDPDHVTDRVSEAAGYELLYSLEIPETGPFTGANIAPYCEDRSAIFTQAFDRVAYYFELDDGVSNHWVYASMDTFTLFPERLALPHHLENPVVFAEVVSNLHVFASAGANVTTGEFTNTGNVEMWPSNYNGGNDRGVPNASGSAYDFGDGNFSANAGYGSFQVHNHDLDGDGPGSAGETIFAYNGLGRNITSDLGIGNQAAVERDWTFAENADQFVVRSLRILVRPSGPAPAPDVPTNLVVTARSFCSLTLDWEEVPFADGYVVRVDGVNVATNARPPALVDQLTGETAYQLSVAARGPGGESAFSAELSATTTPVRVFMVVPEAAGYELVYALPIENEAMYQGTNAVAYCVDNRGSVAGAFDRIAYFLELDNGSVDQWVYVSMDPFSTNITEIGIPHPVDNPVAFQLVVSNMTVIASTNANVTTGQFENTGLIEIWPSSYSPSNPNGIPNASATTFDFGDGDFGTGAGHGSFQVHNFDIDGAGTNTVGETLFAYNRFGTGPTDSLGIGNRPTSHPDWTFAGNVASYEVKNLFVLVRPLSDDRDGDGASDADEEIAGTNPDDPNSFPGLGIAASAGQVINFQSVLGRTYRVQVAEDLQNPVWTDVYTVAGDGTEQSFVIPVTSDQRLYYQLLITRP